LIKNAEVVRNLDKAILRREKSDYTKNIRIIEALYKEAIFLGVFPPADPCSGLDIDIKIARVINSVSESS
jgi:hypothetical protein